MATQAEIAEQLGLDVSSVNKILNKVRGPSFRKETVRLVQAKARELGYVQSSASKGVMRRTLENLFPREGDNLALAALRGVDFHEVVRIKKMLYGPPDFKL